jgi:hypothetical protein
VFASCAGLFGESRNQIEESMEDGQRAIADTWIGGSYFDLYG